MILRCHCYYCNKFTTKDRIDLKESIANRSIKEGIEEFRTRTKEYN